MTDTDKILQLQLQPTNISSALVTDSIELWRACNPSLYTGLSLVHSKIDRTKLYVSSSKPTWAENLL